MIINNYLGNLSANDSRSELFALREGNIQRTAEKD